MGYESTDSPWKATPSEAPRCYRCGRIVDLGPPGCTGVAAPRFAPTGAACLDCHHLEDIVLRESEPR